MKLQKFISGLVLETIKQNKRILSKDIIEKIMEICSQRKINITYEYAEKKMSNCLTVFKSLGYCASENSQIVLLGDQPKKRIHSFANQKAHDAENIIK